MFQFVGIVELKNCRIKDTRPHMEKETKIVEKRKKRVVWKVLR